MALSIETVLRIDLLGGIALSIEKRFGLLGGMAGKISSDCSLELRKFPKFSEFRAIRNVSADTLIYLSGRKEYQYHCTNEIP
ncbi:unnamed protein product [Rhizophagus irregularis]|nr:unnamed protein product [Rhizophagus irregularis]